MRYVTKKMRYWVYGAEQGFFFCHHLHHKQLGEK